MGVVVSVQSIDSVVGTEISALSFLDHLQLVLAESLTSSTYKYALLWALADICVEQPCEPTAELTIPIPRIAEQFLLIYWRHGLPYGSGVHDEGGGVLLQNRGPQASVIGRANDLRRRFGTPAAARRDPAWSREIRWLAALLDDMPLWRLQRLRTTTVDCFYAENRGENSVTLRTGVAYNFRRFHSLVVRLVQAEWMAFLHELPANQAILGSAGDLGDFLFGPQRDCLALVRDPLIELQSGRCFYCEERLVASTDVDHFIPWSRYPRNLMHNLVAAHRRCNTMKSNILPAMAHYVRWRNHVDRLDEPLRGIADKAGILADRATAIQVAEWCYDEARRVRAEVWLGGDDFERL